MATVGLCRWQRARPGQSGDERKKKSWSSDVEKRKRSEPCDCERRSQVAAKTTSKHVARHASVANVVLLSILPLHVRLVDTEMLSVVAQDIGVSLYPTAGL